MKKNILVAMALLLLVVSGCSGSKKKSDKVIIWAWDPNFNIKIMNEAIEVYKEDNPDAEFEVVDLAKADVEQKLTSSLASNATSELPDIVLIEDYNAQKYLQSFPDAFADLTDKVEFSNFVDYKVKVMSMNDKVYGVPFDSGVAVLYYRTDILEEAGFKASDLENITWDRYIEIGKVVKEKTGKAMLAHNPQDTGLLRIMMQSASTWYTDDAGEINLKDNKAIAESLDVMKSLVDSGIIVEAVDWATWIAPTTDGEAASFPTGIWITGTVKSAEDQSGKWSVAPIPRLTKTKSVNASNLGGSSWYVLDSSKKKDAAINFLNDVYAKNSDFYQSILTDTGAMGSYIPSQTGTAYEFKDPFFAEEPVMGEIAKWMQEVPAVNYGAYTYDIDSAIIAQLSDFYSGKIDAYKVLANAQEQAKSAIK